MADESYYRWNRSKASSSDKQSRRHSWTYDGGQCVSHCIELSKKVRHTNRTFDDTFFTKKTLTPETSISPIPDATYTCKENFSNAGLLWSGTTSNSNISETITSPISTSSTFTDSFADDCKDTMDNSGVSSSTCLEKDPSASSTFTSPTSTDSCEDDCRDSTDYTEVSIPSCLVKGGEQDPYALPADTVVANNGTGYNQIIFREKPLASVTSTTVSRGSYKTETKHIGVDTSDLERTEHSADIGASPFSDKPGRVSTAVGNKGTDTCISWIKECEDFRDAWHKFCNKKDVTMLDDLHELTIAETDVPDSSGRLRVTVLPEEFSAIHDEKPSRGDCLVNESVTPAAKTGQLGSYLSSQMENVNRNEWFIPKIIANDVDSDGENVELFCEYPQTPCPSSVSERVQLESDTNSRSTLSLHALFSSVLNSCVDSEATSENSESSRQLEMEGYNLRNFDSLLKSRDNFPLTDLNALYGISGKQFDFFCNKMDELDNKLCEKLAKLEQAMEKLEDRTCPGDGQRSATTNVKSNDTAKQENESQNVTNQLPEEKIVDPRDLVSEGIVDGNQDRQEPKNDISSRSQGVVRKTFRQTKMPEFMPYIQAKGSEETIPGQDHVKSGAETPAPEGKRKRKRRRRRNKRRYARLQGDSTIAGSGKAESVDNCNPDSSINFDTNDDDTLDVLTETRQSKCDEYLDETKNGKNLDAFFEMAHRYHSSGLPAESDKSNPWTSASSRNHNRPESVIACHDNSTACCVDSWVGDADSVSYGDESFEPVRLATCMSLSEDCVRDIDEWLNIERSWFCGCPGDGVEKNDYWNRSFEDADLEYSSSSSNLTFTPEYQRVSDFLESMVGWGDESDGDASNPWKRVWHDFSHAFRAVCRYPGMATSMLRSSFCKRICLLVLGVVIMKIVLSAHSAVW